MVLVPVDPGRGNRAPLLPGTETMSFICIMEMMLLYRELDQPILRQCPY